MERSGREPTVEEIVVALQETRRGGRRDNPLTVRNSQPDATDASIDITDLRDAEFERLLTENARLNQRVVYLLKVIEAAHARAAEAAAEIAAAPVETDRGTIRREMRAALEAELRPVLLALVERRPGNQPSLRRTVTEAAVPSQWIVDLMQRLADEGATTDGGDLVSAGLPRPSLRQRLAHLRDALRF